MKNNKNTEIISLIDKIIGSALFIGNPFNKSKENVYCCRLDSMADLQKVKLYIQNLHNNENNNAS